MKAWKSVAALAGILLLPSQLYAQSLASESDLSSVPADDWAAAFIDFLFKGGDLSLTSTHLAPLTEALRHALSAYSVAMLVLAGFLLFYHIAAMVAETAHQGVVMGRRANQLWTPIRLVAALILLVPVSSGLSVGQHIVLKIASYGSDVASHLWTTVTRSFDANFFGLVTPRGPSLSRFVATSLEMEMCRAIYEQLRGAQSTDPGLRLVDNITGLTTLNATSLTPETWRYTNSLNNSVPMCGEYRFTGHRQYEGSNSLYADGTAHIAADISTFSHAEANTTLIGARDVALSTAAAFTSNDATNAPPLGNDASSLRQSLQRQINTHLQTLSAAQNMLVAQSLTPNNQTGWITAAFFIPNIVRLQESYGELADHMLPDAQEPVFTHRILTQQVLSDAFTEDPILRSLDHENSDSVARFYAKVARANAKMHNWLYATQTEGSNFLPSSGFDLRDQVNAATDASASFSLFAHAIDVAAIDYGVWGNVGDANDQGNPFVFAASKAVYNPLTALVEFGHRQFALGIYLVGLASSVITVPQLIAPSILAGALGVFFIAGALGLTFLIPLLPFVRFLFAVLVWLVELVEAMIAMPLVAIAHMTPVGQGLSGSAARQAYMLWIALAIRPVLSIFGLIAGVLVFALGNFILSMAFMPLAQLTSVNNSGLLIVANTGLVVAYDILIYIVANAAFKGITYLPNQALRWVSPFVMTEGSSQEAPANASASASATASSPTAISAFAQTMSHYSGAGIFHSAQGTQQGGASSTPGTKNQSSLFPLHTKDAGASTHQAGSQRGNTSAASSSATAASLGITQGAKNPSPKKDEKPKDEPFLAKPVQHDEKKSEEDQNKEKGGEKDK